MQRQTENREKPKLKSPRTEKKKCGQIRYFVVSLSTHILNSSVTITVRGLLFNWKPTTNNRKRIKEFAFCIDNLQKNTRARTRRNGYATATAKRRSEQHSNRQKPHSKQATLRQHKNCAKQSWVFWTVPPVKVSSKKAQQIVRSLDLPVNCMLSPKQQPNLVSLLDV